MPMGINVSYEMLFYRPLATMVMQPNMIDEVARPTFLF